MKKQKRREWNKQTVVKDTRTCSGHEPDNFNIVYFTSEIKPNKLKSK